MRFIHLSDVRIGLHTESGRPWGRERVSEVAATLGKVAQAAEERRIDIVLIAGGLFAHRPVTAELQEANRVFAAHPGTVFVIVAGESDSIKKNSPVLSFHWASNVHYCTAGHGEKLTFASINTVVYTRSVTEDTGSGEELIALLNTDATAADLPTIRIALEAVSSTEQATHYCSSGFSYVALGGVQTYSEVMKDRVYYSGGIEPEGMTDTGIHGFVQGEISPVTGTVTAMEFVPMASASYIPLLIKINTSVTPEAFSDMVEQEIQRRGISNIYRIRITGQKLPEFRFDLNNLKLKYRITEVMDEAEPQYDFEALFEEHQQDMIGYFISTLRRKNLDLPDIDKKAMFRGIDALIKTSETEGKKA